MRDPPDCQPSLWAVHHRLRRNLVFYFFFSWSFKPFFFLLISALSRRPYLCAPHLAFGHFYFPIIEQPAGAKSLLTGLPHPDPFFVSNPPPFLPCLLCSPPRYSSRTLVVTLLRIYSLVAPRTTAPFTLVAFPTKSPPCPGPSLMFGVRYAIFGTLYTDALLIARHLLSSLLPRPDYYTSPVSSQNHPMDDGAGCRARRMRSPVCERRMAGAAKKPRRRRHGWWIEATSFHWRDSKG